MTKIKVLAIDESVLYRDHLNTALSRLDDIQLIGPSSRSSHVRHTPPTHGSAPAGTTGFVSTH